MVTYLIKYFEVFILNFYDAHHFYFGFSVLMAK